VQQFSLNRAQFDAKIQEIAAQTGIQLEGDSGAVKIPNTSMVVNYTYDGSTLKVDIEGGNLLTRDFANKRLAGFLETA
jgi:antitoxin component of MazEF toxin-antitoxin module